MTENNYTGKILVLKDEIDYSKNSIVSKVILEANGGNSTLFAIDDGQFISEHTAPFDALVFILEGEAEIKINKEPFVLSEGKMIIMPKNIAHALKALKRFKMLLIMIK